MKAITAGSMNIHENIHIWNLIFQIANMYLCWPYAIKHHKTFFNLNISPGSSHPSTQRGARPLTGDLPTTASPPETF